MSQHARASIVVAAVAVIAISACAALQPVHAQSCPPVRAPQAGDRCTAAFIVPNRDKPDQVPVYVVRFKSLDSSDYSSWTVPGAIVVPLDGTQRGQQVAVPLSILSECRP
jgi:hypothetical protein